MWGLGETYRDGDWDSPDVTAVVALFASNAELVDGFLARSPLARFLLQMRHLILNRNTKSGSKRNISAHYDLGNSFYERWLDRGMTYSSRFLRRATMISARRRIANIGSLPMRWV